MVDSADGKPSIMVVEDNDDLREAVLTLLARQGYKVLGFENGAAALDYLRTATILPRLVILDLMMPLLNGIEFRESQLADARMAGIPVIILSAWSRTRADLLAPVAAMPKPVDFEELLRLVDTHAGPPSR